MKTLHPVDLLTITPTGFPFDRKPFDLNLGRRIKPKSAYYQL